jgi:FtsZ-interacting cell division protein ZipA
MSTVMQVVIAIVVIAVIAVVLGLLAWRRTRTQRLREEFGPEYDRAVERHGDRDKAEHELLDRKRRHEELDIRPLEPRARERYRDEWAHIQEQFVDNPEAAVEQADRLVTTVMAERGYPTKDFDDRIATLSVEHGRTLDHYRRGHEISARASHKEASTEDLRQATVHYRALFEVLLTPSGEHARRPGDARPDSGSTSKE